MNSRVALASHSRVHYFYNAPCTLNHFHVNVYAYTSVI